MLIFLFSFFLIEILAPTTYLECQAIGGADYGTKCFLAFYRSSVMNTNEANSLCIGKSATLPSLHSLREYNTFSSLTPFNQYLPLGLRYIYLDPQDPTNVTFAWSDGSSFNYSVWYPGYPGINYGICTLYYRGQYDWFNYPCETPIVYYTTCQFTLTQGFY